MKIYRLISFIAITAFAFSAANAQDGEQIFKANCASCHALGKKLVGPDLIGVNERREEKWLLKWIKSSQTLIKEGDPVAIQVYNENNKIPMTDAYINEDEIKAVLAYIKTKGTEMASSGGTQTAPAASAGVAAASVAPSTPPEPNVSLLNVFSFTEYLLLGLLFLLLMIIWVLARSIKGLSRQLQEKYNGQ